MQDRFCKLLLQALSTRYSPLFFYGGGKGVYYCKNLKSSDPESWKPGGEYIRIDSIASHWMKSSCILHFFQMFCLDHLSTSITARSTGVCCKKDRCNANYFLTEGSCLC